MFTLILPLMATYFVTLIDTLSTIEVVIATGYDIHALYYLDPALVYTTRESIFMMVILVSAYYARHNLSWSIETP